MVVALRSKLLARDPFYIFRLNDKNMNDKPTFVFKSSQNQIHLVTEMDRDGTRFVNDEYSFANGTFKGSTGFVILSV